MKKLLYLLIPGVLISCDVLDVEPTDRVLVEDALDSERGLRTALTGTYDALQADAIAQHFMVFGDLAADNLEAVGSKIPYDQVFDNRININNIDIESIWNAHYDAINRANTALAQIDNVLQGAAAANIRGQLLAIRALCHFNLVRAFGPVPLKTEFTQGISSEELDIPRSSIETVYAQIVADLEQASRDLDPTGKGDPSIMSKGSVLALLAKVHLYQENYGLTIDYADSVIGLGYSLVPGADFDLLYDEQESNDEIIFQIDFSDDDVNELAEYFQPAARYEVGLTNSAFEIYEDSDLRAFVSAVASSGNLSSDKYQQISTDSDNSIVIRLADVLLMKAEALNEIGYVPDGEAFDMLNTVRDRAGISMLTAANTPNQGSFRLAVEAERRKEFLAEGHRWFDLIRTNRAIAVLGPAKGLNNPNFLRFPIPASELATNNHPDMIQNDDY